jgi:hypothetical protein
MFFILSTINVGLIDKDGVDYSNQRIMVDWASATTNPIVFSFAV